MDEKKLLKRIALKPGVMAGKPVIRGTRLTVESVLNQLAHGATAEDLIREYRGLKRADIQACLLYASKALEFTEIDALALGRA
ncbi:MAG: DUF433 domain-containing protein [Planctomycetes bacterium]|nr:DUF433 domain-containing protein [Planctomycetota bacterium]